MGKFIDLTGQRFGLLTVIERVLPNTAANKARWRCLCDCGNETVAVGGDLKSGNTTSCGCVGLQNLIRNPLDLVSQRFGLLTVIKRVFPNAKDNGTRWLCKCDCGNEKIVASHALKSGNTKSCGCLPYKVRKEKREANFDKRDLAGQTFGKWLVLERVIRKEGRKEIIYWKCLCACGTLREVCDANLRSGDSKSCGCRIKEYFEEKRKRPYISRLSSVHKNMVQRCLNPKNKNYKHYGGRGIVICEEWRDTTTFYKWAVQTGYKEGLTLDRINNDGNYCPENCRWATGEEQGNNRRNNILLTYNGITMSLALWAKKLNVTHSLLYDRKRLGWTDEKILTTPRQTKNK